LWSAHRQEKPVLLHPSFFSLLLWISRITNSCARTSNKAALCRLYTCNMRAGARGKCPRRREAEDAPSLPLSSLANRRGNPSGIFPHEWRRWCRYLVAYNSLIFDLRFREDAGMCNKGRKMTSTRRAQLKRLLINEACQAGGQSQ